MTYRGNPLLKKLGTTVSWTPELLAEMEKCSNDPVYFIQTYMRIVHVDRGLIPFELYPYQVELVHSMWKNRFTGACMARQSGKSIAVCGFLLWYVLFHENKEVGLLANKGDTAIEMLGRIQLAYQYLPKWITQGVAEWNKGSFLLENGSKIIAAASSSDNVRGHSFTIVYLDEMAFIEHYEEFAASVLPTISSGTTTKIVATSTPHGLNHFWTLIERGKKPHDDPEWNGFHVLEVPWHKVPGRDESWREATLRQLNHDHDKFDQEYNIQFLGSSGTLIAGWKLKQLVAQVPLEQVGALYMYENPIPGHRYFMAIDTSEGKGLDYSTFQVIDITAMPYKQVCCFRSNLITPIDFAQYIHQTAIKYNNAYTFVEINSLGEGLAWILFFDFEYENVLMTENWGRKGKKLLAGFGNKKADKGIRTTEVTKLTGCSILKLLVEQNGLLINDAHTIYELSRFSRNGRSWKAEEGAHDDLTMCLVIFAWATNQLLFKELTDINTLLKMQEIDEETIENQMTPFGFVDDGFDDLGIDIINDPNSKTSYMNNF